jgi:NAD(P)H dehydrogenase (quinone)
MTDTVLVTGASGQLGGRVIELLLESGVGSIIATTRNPDKLAHFANRGVQVRYANFDEPESLPSAFAGANRLLLISTDALDEVGKRLRQHKVAVKGAQEAGVSHIVYTSLISADDSPVLFAPDHAGTEQAIMESGLGYTILRNNLYMDLLISSVSQAYQIGGLYGASADGKTSYITREDCAKVAASALSASFDGKRILNITGAEALSQSDIATLASTITGKPLSYIPVPLQAVIGGMVGAGLPQAVAEVYASIDVAIEQGKMGVVSSDFNMLTGASPTTTSDFLKTHLN